MQELQAILEQKIEIPKVFSTLFQEASSALRVETELLEEPVSNSEGVDRYFSQLDSKSYRLKVCQGTSANILKRVGVVLSGGPAPGGHNVIWGLFEGLRSLSACQEVPCELIGFLNGPSGILKNETLRINHELLMAYRNQGGFDLLGSGRTKIKTQEQFAQALQSCREQDLDALVIIGGDDSNTNAATLAQYFAQNGLKTRVIGVPKTIDGDLRSKWVEMTFGHDSACGVYSSLISAIARDALSSRKYYHFIRLMGRSASHITLECALRTQPAYAIIAEEVKEKAWSLQDLIDDIASTIASRMDKGIDWGIILVPEGIIEFIPEFSLLIEELNALLAKTHGNVEDVIASLSSQSAKLWDSLPQAFAQTLLCERDPHGNVQVSLIESERLIAQLVAQKLGRFNYRTHFFGYEARAVPPSFFDRHYSFSLGLTAALGCASCASGMLVSVCGLNRPVCEWEAVMVSLKSMIAIEMRDGKQTPVISKALVDLQGKPFSFFQKCRNEWAKKPDNPLCLPLQYLADKEISDTRPLSL